jgi:GrpB-like predicted nucleotidyltransferase (UPF0157 family)
MGESRREPVTTDEHLERITVGDVQRLDGPVALAEYDPAWAARYARLAREIGAGLGGRMLRIEHVGSTSVPGLAAKPIVDIVLVVPDSAEEADYVPPLEGAGFFVRIREPDWYEHRMLTVADRSVNLHVFGEGCSEVDRMVRFRDRLRADPAERDRYESVKRELAARRWRHLQNYADAKTAVVDEILSRAP